jgi:hypothetical protein
VHWIGEADPEDKEKEMKPRLITLMVTLALAAAALGTPGEDEKVLLV